MEGANRRNCFRMNIRISSIPWGPLRPSKILLFYILACILKDKVKDTASSIGP